MFRVRQTAGIQVHHQCCHRHDRRDVHGDECRWRRSSSFSLSNVLLLICDDLYCDPDCSGHPLVKTPNIDQFVQRGVRFKRESCQYPLCGPVRASFMTGLYPDQTRIRRNSIHLGETLTNVQTKSQLMRRHCYGVTPLKRSSFPAPCGCAAHWATVSGAGGLWLSELI